MCTPCMLSLRFLSAESGLALLAFDVFLGNVGTCCIADQLLLLLGHRAAIGHELLDQGAPLSMMFNNELESVC